LQVLKVYLSEKANRSFDSSSKKEFVLRRFISLALVFLLVYHNLRSFNDICKYITISGS